MSQHFFPGKVILTGEHSVVYGHPAVVASISRGLTLQTVSMSRTENSWKKQVEWQNHRYFQEIIRVIANAFSISVDELPDFAMTVESELPQNAGLGSSAAFAAAVLECFTQHLSITLQTNELFELVWQAEKFAHGNSSGLDPAAVVYQKLLVFSKTETVPQIETLVLGAQMAQTPFFLIDSGVTVESTAQMVSWVRQQLALDQQKKRLLSRLALLVQDWQQILLTDQMDPTVLQRNEELLEDLGIVSPSTQQLIAELVQHGGFAKVTGAGGRQQGSGFILAYSPRPEEFTQYLDHQKLAYFPITLGQKRK